MKQYLPATAVTQHVVTWLLSQGVALDDPYSVWGTDEPPTLTILNGAAGENGIFTLETAEICLAIVEHYAAEGVQINPDSFIWDGPPDALRLGFERKLQPMRVEAWQTRPNAVQNPTAPVPVPVQVPRRAVAPVLAVAAPVAAVPAPPTAIDAPVPLIETAESKKTALVEEEKTRAKAVKGRPMRWTAPSWNTPSESLAPVGTLIVKRKGLGIVTAEPLDAPDDTRVETILDHNESE